MTNSTAFLQKYRVLEDLLDQRYISERLGTLSSVTRYLKDPDSRPVCTDLDLCRNIRNLLSHNACTDGTPVVEPADEILAKLDSIIEYVRTPRRVTSFGTPHEGIRFAHPDSRIREVMRDMVEQGYSHVPVVSFGVFKGIFSVHTLFDYISEHGMGSLSEDARIEDLGDCICIDRHVGETYRFVSADTSINAVRDAFAEKRGKHDRLVMVLVTQNGTPDERLICMLTPWDVLGENVREGEKE